MEVVLRVAKSTLIAAVTFGSVWSISGSASIALAVALIPLLLGSLAMLSEFAYGLAALSLITAVTLQVIPNSWVETGRRIGEQVIMRLEKSQ